MKLQKTFLNSLFYSITNLLNKNVYLSTVIELFVVGLAARLAARLAGKVAGMLGLVQNAPTTWASPM